MFGFPENTWTIIISFCTGGGLIGIMQTLISKKQTDANVFSQMQDSYAKFVADHEKQLTALRENQESQIKMLQLDHQGKISRLERDIIAMKKQIKKCLTCPNS